MKTSNSNDNDINIVRIVFIETLSDEFVQETGVGAYAYLGPADINRLFKEYLHQSKTLKRFSRYCVKQYFNLL